MRQKNTRIALILLFVIILLDQGLKIWIKTNMFLGEEFNVIGDWFKIHFTENKGMAFGIEIAGEKGKLFLTLFRIIAAVVIGWFLHKIIKQKASTGVVISITLILAGAIGNIIDSTFYGIIFNNSHFQVASLLPNGGGYAPLFHGRVVDMLYFPIINTNLPDWLPFFGGRHFIFFRPVFNIADSAITIGVLSILLFHKTYFKHNEL